MATHTFTDTNFEPVTLNPVSVKGRLDELHSFNRVDLVEELKSAWEAHHGEKPFPEFVPEIPEIPTFVRGRTLNEGYFQPPVATGPAEPDAAIMKVHTPSKTVFLQAQCGNGLTGLVRIGEDLLRDTMSKATAARIDKQYESKIFLLPCAPSEKYPIRPWLAFNARVYQAVCEEAIVHGGGAQGLQSHRQLADFIRRKEPWEDLSQDRGLYLGFTVVRGGEAGMPNRFAFTSMSSNQPTYLPHEKVKTLRGAQWMSAGAAQPTGTVTLAWARKIKDTINSIH